MVRAAVGFVVFLCLAGVVFAVYQHRESGVREHDVWVLELGGTKVVAEVVADAVSRAQGLSGRASLTEGEGMLFVFEEPGLPRFWMRNMLFPIDILWLDADLKVVWLKESADPSSYPEYFAPRTPALYVLEVPAGFSHVHGVTVGTDARIVSR